MRILSQVLLEEFDPASEMDAGRKLGTLMHVSSKYNYRPRMGKGFALRKISPNVKKKAGAKISHLPGKPGTRKQLLPLLPFGPDGVGSVSATRLPFHFSKNGGEERIRTSGTR
jgi:hypothetical protein